MKIRTLATILAIGITTGPAWAANVDVQMLNKGEKGTFVFQPDLVRINVGDTVTFKAVDKGHIVDGAAGSIPTAATPFKGQVSQDLTQAFTVPGVYVVKCDPHYGLGMVGVVVVGDDRSNLDALRAVKNPPKAQDRLNAIFDQLAK